MPGVSFIVGLPDILWSFLDLFISMLNSGAALVKESTLCANPSRSVSTSQFSAVSDLVEYTVPEHSILPDIMKPGELSFPWRTISAPAPEEEEIPDPCSFRLESMPPLPPGPLALANLEIPLEERLATYWEELKTHLSPAAHAYAPMVELFRRESTIDLFVPPVWKGLVTEPVNIVFVGLPVSHRPPARPINPRLYEHAHKEFQRLCGYIYVPSNSPIASPLVTADKATKPYIRFCGDYTWINKHHAIPHYTIPNVQHSIARAAGFSMWADLDMANSFHQIPVDYETSMNLSIQTPWGLVRPLFLPEGVAPASGILQTIMSGIFTDFLDWMIVIFDNMLVLSHDIADLHTKLTRVFARAKEYNVVLRMPKSWIGVLEATFFGYRVKPGCWELTAERRAGVTSMPFPDNLKKVQRFLGCALFFANFVPNYSELTAPLSTMTKSTFDWNDQAALSTCRSAFEVFKQALLASFTLFFPNYDLPWIMRVDASDLAVAMVLFQVVTHQDDRTEYQPILFSSKKFSDQALRWDAHKKEAYGVVYGVSSASYYVRGKHFTLETDHRNLLYMDQNTSAIVVRWRTYLQSYSFLLRHLAGKKNLVADWQSRMYLLSLSPEDYHARPPEPSPAPGIMWPEPLLDYLCEREPPAVQPAHESILATLCTPTTPSVACPCGSPSHIQELRAKSLPELTADDYLSQVHGGRHGHLSPRKTWRALNKIFPGHRISIDYVNRYIDRCAVCEKMLRGMVDSVEPIVRHIKPKYMRRRVGVDELTVTPADKHGNCKLLIIVNHWSKHADGYPANSYTAPAVAAALFRYFATWGGFEELASDPGSSFMSDVVAQLNSWLGISHRVSLVDRHESNGVEGTCKIVIRHLRPIIHDERVISAWSEPHILPWVFMAHNSSVHSETGFTPHELVFGSVDAPFHMWPPELSPDLSSASAFLTQLNTVIKAIREVSQPTLPELHRPPAHRGQSATPAPECVSGRRPCFLPARSQDPSPQQARQSFPGTL